MSAIWSSRGPRPASVRMARRSAVVAGIHGAEGRKGSGVTIPAGANRASAKRHTGIGRGGPSCSITVIAV